MPPATRDVPMRQLNKVIVLTTVWVASLGLAQDAARAEPEEAPAGGVLH